MERVQEKYWVFEGIFEFLKKSGGHVKVFAAKIDENCMRKIRNFQESKVKYISKISKEIISLIGK